MRIREIIALVIITVLAFSACLSNGFIGDDEVLFVKNNFYKSPENISLLFSKEYLTKSEELYLHPKENLGSGSIAYRPVLSATYFLDYWLWKMNPYGYHLTSLLFHLINVLLVYFFVLSFMKEKGVAFLSAILFSLHPVKVEAVASVGYRADVLVCMFVLLAFLSFIKFRKSILPYLFFGLALFSKEAAIVFPALVIVYDYFYDEVEEPLYLRMIRKDYWGFYLVSGIYLFVYLKVFPNTTLKGMTLIGGSIVTHIVSVLWIFVLYLNDLFLPFMVKMLPPLYLPKITIGLASAGLIAVIIITILIAFIYQLRKRNNESLFFIAWFLIALIPILNIVPIANPMAHRFMYLPSVGFCIAIAILLCQVAQRLRKKKAIASSGIMLNVFIVCVCFIMTLSLSRQWRSNYSVGDNLIKNFPRSEKGYEILGEFNFKSGRYVEANIALKKAIELGSKNPRMFYMLGMSSLDNYAEAQRYLLASMSNNGEYVAPLLGLGRLYFLHREYDKAKIFLRKASSIKPGYVTSGYLIQIYMRQDKLADAYKILEKAKNINLQEEEIKSLEKLIERNTFKPVDIGI